MKRTLSLVLVLAMVFSAMLGVISFAEEGSTTPKALEVTHANLEFASAVYLYVAVDYSAFGSADGITLSIRNKVTNAEVILNPTTSITAPANHVAFKYTQLGAQNMGDELLIQALKDGVASGEAKTYSVLEYALVAQGQGDEKLTNLMKAMLQYGMDAQKAFGHNNPTYDLSKEYSFTKLVGGAYFEDGSTKVIMGEGSATKTATIAGATDSTYWYNTNRDYLGTGKTLSVPYKKGGQIVYTALGTPLDMRSYTGAPVIEASTSTSKVYSYKYADGTVATRPTDWINSNVLNNDTQRTITYNPGYIEYNTASANGMLFTHSGFFNKAMYDQVMADSGKFTVSLTVSSNLTNKVFDMVGFRAYGSKVSNYTYTKTDGTTFQANIVDTQVITTDSPKGAEDIGRLYFLEQGSATTLEAYYNNNGWGNKGSALSNFAFDNSEEFVTIDIVFDISHTVKCTNGICKGSTGKCKCYTCGQDGIYTAKDASGTTQNIRCTKCTDANGTYVGNANVDCTTCLGDKLCYIADYYVDGVKVGSTTFATKDSYWQRTLAFELQAAKGCAGKIQSIIVSPFDINAVK